MRRPGSRVTRTFQCMPDLWEGFTRLCADKGVSASNTIERMVEAFFEERIIIIEKPQREVE